MDGVFAHLASLDNFQRMLGRRSVFSEATPEDGNKPN